MGSHRWIREVPENQKDGRTGWICTRCGTNRWPYERPLGNEHTGASIRLPDGQIICANLTCDEYLVKKVMEQ